MSQAVHRSSFRAAIVLLGAASSVAACSALLDLHVVPYDDDAGDAARPAPVEAGSEAGTCPAAAIGCQDFEEGGVSAPWRLDDNDGGASVRVESTAAHGGSFALDVALSSAGVGSGVIAFLAAQPFATGSHVFVRAWFRVDTSLANASLIELRHDRRSLSGGVSLKLIDGKLAYNVTDRSLATRGSGTADAGPARGVWECLRFAVDVGPSGTVTIFRGDDVVLKTGTVDTVVGEPSWESLWLGYPFADAPAGGAEVIVDDIVVASTPVLCTN